MDIKKMISLNKEHLSLATRKMLQDNPSEFAFLEIHKKRDGWFIYIDKDWFYDSIRYGKHPADLKTVVAFAIHCECDVLCIDDATEPIMCLPHYKYRFDVPVTGGNPGETCTVEEIWCGGGKIAHNILRK